MNFLPLPLKYQYSEYLPHISNEIMKLHYEKHYIGYLTKFNIALSKYPEYCDWKVEKILKNLEKLPCDIKNDVKNNGGGFHNHSLFWEILNPIEKELNLSIFDEEIISDSFENFEKFKNLFFEACNKHFGSGWCWLVVSKENLKLKIYSLNNQDSPLSLGDYPILGIDLWEHAYYLQYKNLRSEYIEKVWQIIDWKVVFEKYQFAITKYFFAK